MFSHYDQADRKSRALRSLEDVLVTFGAGESTQHFSKNPIRMAVWLAFAGDPIARRQLLIDLNYLERAERAMRTLKTAYEKHEPYRKGETPPLLSFGSIVMAAVNMDDMIQVILPQTYWFQALDPVKVKQWRSSVDAALRTETLEKLRSVIAASPLPPLWCFLVSWMAIREAEAEQVRRDSAKKGIDRTTLPGRWDSLLVSCTHLMNVTSNDIDSVDASDTHAFVVDFLAKALDRYGDTLDALVELQDDLSKNPGRAPIWSIDLNRTAELASLRSRQTLKVDAAENVFRISTDSVRWAVIDSGIDASHPAFAKPGAATDEPWQDTSRIVASYDFTRLHKIFERDFIGLLPEEKAAAAELLIDAEDPFMPDDLNEAVPMMLYVLNGNDNDHVTAETLSDRMKDDSLADRARDFLRTVRRGFGTGDVLDWQLLEPLLQVSHAEDLYCPPGNAHGTHVAGILAGQMTKGILGDQEGPPSDHCGMCPDLELYDLRVCDKKGRSDEFLVMSALQFVAYLNRTREITMVDGANVSLQIKYDVTNYGCGQTPVCKEANRLVDSGVCVVAAAGNHGYHSVVTAKTLVDSYAWCSIMDPGNAEKVITVGSTHRISPHTFGISYFSSRGPTADGRPKPDLVAPGEKILGPVPGRKMAEDSGTSMSAPHVSGAAAMLMARYPEMKGQPAWLKKVLCDTATDLGRRPEFQGAGLVDVLRALESI